MELKRTALAAATFAVVFGSGFTSAFVLYPGTDIAASSLLEDDDVDYFIDNDNDGLISVGDVLVAPFEFGAIRDIFPPIDPGSPQALSIDDDNLTGISTIKVKSINAVTGEVQFEQSGDIPVIQIYSDTGTGVNLDTSNCGLMAACTAAASDGDGLWASFTIDTTADADTGWVFNPVVAGAPGALDPTAIAGTSQLDKIGIANFALTLVTNNSGYDFQDFNIGAAKCGLLFGAGGCTGDAKATLTGSADILGALFYENVYDRNSNPTGAFATSDADIGVSTVPVPGTIALIGLGMLGLGGFMQKRKKA